MGNAEEGIKGEETRNSRRVQRASGIDDDDDLANIKSGGRDLTAALSSLKKMNDQKSPEDIRLIKRALHRSRFFTCLDEDQIQRFIDAAVVRRYRPGEIVILQGSVDDDSPGRVDPSISLGIDGVKSLVRETTHMDDEEIGRLVQGASAFGSSDSAGTGNVPVADALKSVVDVVLSTRDNGDDNVADDLDDEIEKNADMASLLSSFPESKVRNDETLNNDRAESAAPGTLAIYAIRKGGAEVSYKRGSSPDCLPFSLTDFQRTLIFCRPIISFVTYRFGAMASILRV